MTQRERLTKMADAALRGFQEEPGSPAAINGALLVIAFALVVAADGPALDSGFRPWEPSPA